MAWTDPATFAANTMLTAAQLNTNVVENLKILRAPRLTKVNGTNTSGYSIAVGTSYVDIDATNLKINITTTGNPVMIGFTGALQCQVNASVDIDVEVDGVTRLGAFGAGGALAHASISSSGVIMQFPASFVTMSAALTPGDHVIKLVGRSTTTAGALMNTAASSVPIFWAWEI